MHGREVGPVGSRRHEECEVKDTSTYLEVVV
jgi:hypothetical protein